MRKKKKKQWGLKISTFDLYIWGKIKKYGT